jgi:menaquinone-dependent protoporphyrinogen IX oxidase
MKLLRNNSKPMHIGPADLFGIQWRGLPPLNFALVRLQESAYKLAGCLAGSYISKLEMDMQRRTFVNLGLAGLGAALVMARPAAAQFIPKPSKEKWAILYGTWYGTARDASVWISEGMGGIASIFDIRQVPADLASYDHLIIGTAVHGGKGPAVFDSYLSSNMDRLQKKIRGLFIVCGNRGKMPGPQETPSYIDNYLGRICKAPSVPKRVFGGRITQSLMPEAEFKQIQDMYAQIGGPAGDWDHLSRPECLKLGKEIFSAKI